MEKQKRQRNTKIIEKTVIVPEIGKLPPQVPELEEAVLGALMLEKDAYSVVSDILKPESFYNPVHNIIFGAIQGLAVQQKPVDVLTVVEELKRRGELQSAGGAVYIAELSEMDIDQLYQWFSDIDKHLSEKQKLIARDVIKEIIPKRNK